MYSDGPNKVFGSEQTIANGIVTVTVKNGAIQGQDDLSVVTCYTYTNGYGENVTTTFGFSNNQVSLGGNGVVSTEPTDDEHIETLAAGLYDANDVQLASWEELTTTYGLDVSKNYTNFAYETDAASPYCVLKLKLPDGRKLVMGEVTTIGEQAFRDCSNLTSITIPDSVTSIGDGAFCRCLGLKSVTFGENSQLTTIGTSTFNSCSGLTSITIPDGVTSIGDYAFYNCKNLANVTFGENSQLTTIGEEAFKECKNLISINIPDGVTTIGKQAFYNCKNLANVTFGENSQLTTIGNAAFLYCDALTSITIPDGVTTIDKTTFKYCRGLTSVTIPASVTSIGNLAFESCKNLTSITFEGMVEQWNAISKTSTGIDAWNYGVPATYVQCSDGQVTLK